MKSPLANRRVRCALAALAPLLPWLPWLLGAAAAPSHADAGLTECRVDGLRNSVLCGAMQRPLDPARPDGVSIEVHFVVVPALARRKLPDPVFLLAGGPGQSAISLAANVTAQFGRLNNRRDIVFVDQRGTGRSAPLMCDDPRHLPLAVQADPARQLLDLQQCRERLQQLPHGDLRFYTTTLAMQDLDAVRRQIGAERINLVGASYGTRAALEYQRAFPQAVRRSVLDGVAPPDMALPESAAADAQAALDALWAACAAQPDCHRDHPTLRRDWQALLASLPRPARVAHPLTGRLEALTVTRDMVLSAARGPLYVPAYAAALPAAIAAAYDGRFEPLLGLSALLGSRRSPPLAMGMHYAVVCSEDLPRMAQAAAAAVPDRSVASSVPAKTTPSALTSPQATAVAPGPASTLPATLPMRAAPASASPSPTAAHPELAAPAGPVEPSGGANDLDFGGGFADQYRRACADWPRGAVPAEFYTMPAARSPVLLLSGGVDPATPPRHAARVAAALGPLARHVVVAHAGHGVMGIGCMRDVLYRFIDAPDDRAALAVDTGCAASVPRPLMFEPIGRTAGAAP